MFSTTTATAMTFSELWGVLFDMELLVKLSLSVAAVLLVTWAYRCYSSREEEKIQVPVTDNKEPENANCQDDKMTRRRRQSPTNNTEDGSQHSGHSATNQTAGARPKQAENGEDASDQSCGEQYISLKGQILSHQKPVEDSTCNISYGSALKLPQPTESGKAGTTGRRSPCFFEKLEGAVDVGRELRQDLEHQGVYSSFLSKAEVKVKDADVVLHGTGNQVAHGKIYDYHVESSSLSITESNNVLGHFESNAASQPVDFGHQGSSLSEAPSSPYPIILCDLDPQQGTRKEPSSSGSLELRRPTKPVLLCKESYMFTAEQSEFYIPTVTPTVSAPVTHDVASTSNESISVHPMMLSSTEGEDLRVKGGADLDTVAGAPFLDIPAKTLDGTDLETLKSKLDLTNCLEALLLAQKHGQISLQRAALEFMSDNYLQVVRDPKIYGQLMAGQLEHIQRQRMRGRRFLMVADVNAQNWAENTEGQAAESEQGRTSSTVYYYDDYNDSWHSLCLIPQQVVSNACAMCTMDNYLFLAVGCQGTDGEKTPSKRVFCYNPLTSVWKEICPMNEARPRCKLAALEGCIYAIGGECLSSVECYDPRKDRWTFVAPLPNDTFAVAHHVTVGRGEIFVSGGALRYMLLRYSPKTDTWKTGVVAGGKDRTVDMVAVGRSLFRFDINPLLGISVYRYHTVARLWYECCSRRFLHCPAFHCTRMDDTIYCVSRQFTSRFEADEISPAFTDENLSVLSAAKGMLFPFVLSLPDKRPQQPSV